MKRLLAPIGLTVLAVFLGAGVGAHLRLAHRAVAVVRPALITG